MKRWFFIFFTFLPFFTKAQIITSFAGGGTSGLGDSGLAINASIPDPMTVTFDNRGNCYVWSWW